MPGPCPGDDGFDQHAPAPRFRNSGATHTWYRLAVVGFDSSIRPHASPAGMPPLRPPAADRGLMRRRLQGGPPRQNPGVPAPRPGCWRTHPAIRPARAAAGLYKWPTHAGRKCGSQVSVHAFLRGAGCTAWAGPANLQAAGKMNPGDLQPVKFRFAELLSRHDQLLGEVGDLGNTGCSIQLHVRRPSALQGDEELLLKMENLHRRRVK